MGDIVISDESFINESKRAMKYGDNSETIIESVVKILKNVCESGIMAGNVADNFKTYSESIFGLKDQLGQILHENAREISNLISEVDTADDYLYPGDGGYDSLGEKAYVVRFFTDTMKTMILNRISENNDNYTEPISFNEEFSNVRIGLLALIDNYKSALSKEYNFICQLVDYNNTTKEEIEKIWSAVASLDNSYSSILLEHYGYLQEYDKAISGLTEIINGGKPSFDISPDEFSQKCLSVVIPVTEKSQKILDDATQKILDSYYNEDGTLNWDRIKADMQSDTPSMATVAALFAVYITLKTNDEVEKFIACGYISSEYESDGTWLGLNARRITLSENFKMLAAASSAMLNQLHIGMSGSGINLNELMKDKDFQRLLLNLSVAEAVLATQEDIYANFAYDIGDDLPVRINTFLDSDSINLNFSHKPPFSSSYGYDENGNRFEISYENSGDNSFLGVDDAWKEIKPVHISVLTAFDSRYGPSNFVNTYTNSYWREDVAAVTLLSYASEKIIDLAISKVKDLPGIKQIDKILDTSKKVLETIVDIAAILGIDFGTSKTISKIDAMQQANNIVADIGFLGGIYSLVVASDGSIQLKFISIYTQESFFTMQGFFETAEGKAYLNTYGSAENFANAFMQNREKDPATYAKMNQDLSNYKLREKDEFENKLKSYYDELHSGDSSSVRDSDFTNLTYDELQNLYTDMTKAEENGSFSYE